jgi:hypothetical protein
VMSGRGLCDESIPHPEESFRVCVCVCVRERDTHTHTHTHTHTQEVQQ